MENTKRGTNFTMSETILKIVGIVVNLLSTVVKTIDLVDRFKHQKSNRRSPK